MKTTTTLVACLLFATHFMYCQETVSSSGGDATGYVRSVSFTVGQTEYNNITYSNGSVTQGVLQPYELSTTLGVELTEVIFELIAYSNPTNIIVRIKKIVLIHTIGVINNKI